jgi:nucleolar protein 58
MLVLFETPAGYALFKVLDEGKLENPDKLHKYFESPEAAQKLYVPYGLFDISLILLM